MPILLIVCHPHPGSFTHAIAEQVRQTLLEAQHTLTWHDLYQEHFDPVLPYAEIVGQSTDRVVNQHLDDLLKADGLVIIHPNWWGKPPALLSGWIDRVLRVNAAYSFPKGGEGGPPIGLLSLSKVLILNTSNTSPSREQAVFGDPLASMWKNCVWEFCGVAQVVRHTFSVIINSTLAEREAWLKQAAQLTATTFSNE